MGCWGITVLESDTGLDTVSFIRRHLPKDGRLQLEKIVEVLKGDFWNAPSDVTDGEAHTSPMALAEIIVKFLDHNQEGLDNDAIWVAQNKKFRNINSFTASRDSVLWVRTYVYDTLQNAIKNTKGYVQYDKRWGGWLEEKNWINWQRHMEMLITRLDMLLASAEDVIEIMTVEEQDQEQVIR